MDQKMQILLDKINIDKDNYQYFSDAKISKIKIHSKTNAWNVFIEKETHQNLSFSPFALCYP